MIYGVGIDLIEVPRVEKQINSGTRFRDRIFTDKEIAYCENKKNKSQNYAARFAAKEAFFKAMGTGWSGGLTFQDVEILNLESGKPEIVLHGKAKRIVEEQNILNIQVSLSHLKDVAGAVVVLEK
ncbi:holo-ACP synthase [Acidobacteriota bacterium]